MMEKRFSQMSKEELKAEIKRLKQEARKIGREQKLNEFEVLFRKIELAESYLINPGEIVLRQLYDVKNMPGIKFFVERMNGIFAWGYFEGEQEERGIPISLLK